MYLFISSMIFNKAFFYPHCTFTRQSLFTAETWMPLARASLLLGHSLHHSFYRHTQSPLCFLPGPWGQVFAVPAQSLTPSREVCRMPTNQNGRQQSPLLRENSDGYTGADLGEPANLSLTLLPKVSSSLQPFSLLPPAPSWCSSTCRATHCAKQWAPWNTWPSCYLQSAASSPKRPCPHPCPLTY